MTYTINGATQQQGGYRCLAYYGEPGETANGVSGASGYTSFAAVKTYPPLPPSPPAGPLPADGECEDLKVDPVNGLPSFAEDAVAWTDKDGFDCSSYDGYTSYCGGYDMSTVMHMGSEDACCACGGGYQA